MPKHPAFYSIRTHSHLHVGSGDAQFGVIDNQVQRDLNTGLPTIHASSLKGALREFFRFHGLEEGQKPGSEGALIQHIFGYVEKKNLPKKDDDTDDAPEKKAENTTEKSHAGQWQFLSGDLLSRPVRSDKRAYLNATSPEVLQALVDKLTLMGHTVPKGLKALAALSPKPGKPMIFDKDLTGAAVEDPDWKSVLADSVPSLSEEDQAWLNTLFGEHLVLVHGQDFRELPLPVIARNYLENGQSKNLWYEEVVPSDARFGVFILQDNAWQEQFNEALKSHQVQIGANASIGYGLCQLREHGYPSPPQPSAV